MKKYLLTGGLLAALAVVMLVGAQVWVNGMQNDVTYKETVLFGNKTWADGVKVRSKIAANYYTLTWTTDFQIGGSKGNTINSNSEFKRTPEGQKRYYENDNPVSIRSEIDANAAADGDGELEVPYGEPQRQMLIDALAQTENGEANTITVSLSDYCDYLPLVSDFRYGWSGSYIDNPQKYFKIPVTKDFPVSVTVRKSTEGKLKSYNIKGDFGIKTCSYAEKDGIYLGFTSPVPESLNAVYFIPYKAPAAKGVDRVAHFEHIEKKCQLPVSENILALKPSEDRKYLYLITCEDESEDFCLSIYKNSAKMQLVNKVYLHKKIDSVRNMIDKNGSILLITEDNQFTLIEKLPGKEEKYKLAFSGTLAPTFETENIYYKASLSPSMNFADMDYDGEKLVLVTLNTRNTKRNIAYNHLIFVFTKDGIKYIGSYSPSCSYAHSESDVSENLDGQPLTVTIPK